MNQGALYSLTQEFLSEEAHIKEGGGQTGKERQKRLNRFTARERIDLLLDDPNDFFELNLWAAYQMYPEIGELPAAGVVTGIGNIHQKPCMIIANDATVKAGAMFPQSVKKVLRAQKIAFRCRLPVIYLVDSSGVYLPLQDEIFPDEDDFGRIFRNNSIFSAQGIPQLAAIMGNCIAGGGYLPVLCDQLLMTEGSGLYLAGPALVKAAIGQITDPEELGGATMHAKISGTVDFIEKDDPTCLNKIRSLAEYFPDDNNFHFSMEEPELSIRSVYDLISANNKQEYEVRELFKSIFDNHSFLEYKAEYGPTLVTGFAKINGIKVGIIANQRKRTLTGRGEIEIGGVLYRESADKAARFILDCNQLKIPLVFFQDVVGFMVGKEAEQSGIIRSGAKLVNAMSNSIVPKITFIIGNSFGAGNYALCGKAYDPTFIFAWPNARYAVMGADQAADTLFTIEEQKAERLGKKLNEKEMQEMHQKIREKFLKQTDIRYGAARGWVDAIIEPHRTREILFKSLILALRQKNLDSFQNGVFQV